MQTIGSSKYLQLPASTASDIGKPSPLALLAATCQRIGAPSLSPTSAAPAVPLKKRPHSPVVDNKTTTVPVARSPSPPTYPSPDSPVTTKIAIAPRPEPKARKSSGAAYELPLTPPTTPPRVESWASSSPRVSAAIPAAPTVTSPPACSSLELEHPSEHLSHVPLHHPVLHLPSALYSPYTVVVPSSHLVSPYAGCVNQCCCVPHPPTLPPMYLPTPLVSTTPTSLLSSPLSFGTYPHHDAGAHGLSPSGKVRVHRALKSPGQDSHPYDINKLLQKRREMSEEEIIDVVSV